ncbi:MAG TPA: TolC family outer membrane protein, partial [Gammaproteobacteria bacterium]|nr:TolC family outer membrane protein [Gammaproteobacteria bacterium]
SGQVSTTGINTGNQFQGDYNTKNYGLNLTQPIYRPEHWSTLEQSRHTERQGLALYLAASQDLILRVSEQYFAILGAQDDLHFARAQRKAFAQQLEQTKQRFDVGLIAITDVHEAQARHDSAVAAEIAAENNLSDQFELLREIIGLPLVDIAELKVTDDVLLILPEPNNLEMWVETAQSHNLDIEAAREGALRAKGEVANRVTGHFPKVDVNASLARNKSAPPFDDLFTQKTINLTLAIPIFEGGGVTYRVREAESRFDEAIQRLDIQRRAVYSLTRQKFRGVLTQISQVRSLAQAVVSNESALRATKAAYEVGTRTVVDVLDAESNLLGAQRDYAKARYEYVLEGLRLKRAAGTLKAQDLYEVNLLLGH